MLSPVIGAMMSTKIIPPAKRPRWLRIFLRCLLAAGLLAVVCCSCVGSLFFNGTNSLGVAPHAWSKTVAATAALILPPAGYLLVVLIVETKGQRRRGVMARGICAACGYDLRATPGRCPECGLVVEEPGVDSRK